MIPYQRTYNYLWAAERTIAAGKEKGRLNAARRKNGHIQCEQSRMRQLRKKAFLGEKTDGASKRAEGAGLGRGYLPPKMQRLRRKDKGKENPQFRGGREGEKSEQRAADRKSHKRSGP